MQEVIQQEFIQQEWKDVEGFEGYYQISSLGNIRSVDRLLKDSFHKNGKFLKSKEKKRLIHKDTGYYYVNLCRDNKYKCLYVHRMVATAFIENPENKPEVNHKDGDKLNPSKDNLEWATSSENQQHRYRILKKYRKSVKFSDEQIRYIRSLTKKRGYIKDVASEMCVTQSEISAIINRKNYNHVS